MDWTALTTAADTGGSPITTYTLEWNQGAGTTFVALVGAVGSPNLGTSYLYDTGVVSGTSYTFRLVAVNKWGAGGPSSTVIIEASTKPDQPATPATAMSGSNVVITWTAPAANGNAISTYTVEIQRADAAYQDSSSSCAGTAATVVAARTCTVTLALLRGAPYSLVYDALVVARITATNANGASTVSTVSTGVARI